MGIRAKRPRANGNKGETTHGRTGFRAKRPGFPEISTAKSMKRNLAIYRKKQLVKLTNTLSFCHQKRSFFFFLKKT